LHDLTVEDIWSPSEQSPEKKEAFEHYLYLVLNERQQVRWIMLSLSYELSWAIAIDLQSLTLRLMK